MSEILPIIGLKHLQNHCISLSHCWFKMTKQTIPVTVYCLISSKGLEQLKLKNEDLKKKKKNL